MTDPASKPPRRQQILQALARELETNPGERITTANLAKAVGVSEAALYRHFAGKADMFGGLIEFAEDSVFGLVNRILSQEPNAAARCENILLVLLGFSERNPGITRILTGEALVGETRQLRSRVGKFYDRLETQLKQVLREGQASGALTAAAPVQVIANLLLAVAAGRMGQFVRSEFSHPPTLLWDEQWRILAGCIGEPR